jgi:Golgi phosphoprotein 3 (GPP34)
VLIAEDLALLLLDARGAFRIDATHRWPALAGALLAELALTGRVGPREGDGRPKAKLVVLDASPTGYAVLDAALGTVRAQAPASPDRLLKPLTKGLEPALLERLATAGAVVEQQSKVLGLFPRRRYPLGPRPVTQQARDRVASALRTGRADTPGTSALVALLSVTGTLPKVVLPSELGLTRRQLADAGQRVASDDRVASAVKRTLDGINAAAASAAAVAAAVAATTSTSS